MSPLAADYLFELYSAADHLAKLAEGARRRMSDALRAFEVPA